MFLFVFFNLYIAFFLDDKGLVGRFLLSDYSLYLGVLLLLVNLIALGFFVKKIPFKVCYDLFAVGALLVWCSYWPPLFRLDAPMFDYFPLYFAFVTAIASILFITPSENMDPDAVKFLQWLSDSGRFHPIIIMIGVIISLVMTEHFMLFPVTITLLIMRFTLACSLNNE